MKHIQFKKIGAVPHQITCPACSALLLEITEDKYHVQGQKYFYNDGDSIPWLEDFLIAQKLIDETDLDSLGDGKWFDFSARFGICPNCEVNYFGATVTMISPAAEISGQFYTVYFLHNAPHERPVDFVAELCDHDRIKAKWLTDMYFTKQRIVQEHSFGPFTEATCSNHTEQPFCIGNFLKNYIADLWPSLVQATHYSLGPSDKLERT